ncbi:MAG: helicase-exonuclease AddAB subunit AddB [Eubacteriales bacterium]
MPLRFILGRAGAGKTYACLSEIAAELEAEPTGPPLIALVPEQASFQTERDLVAFSGGKGFMRAQVLSFRRMAFQVLREVGGAARAHIGELGKRMVLRRLLHKRQAELKVFRRPAARVGFADSLARALGEMKTYCIGPDDLLPVAAELREAGASLLADKLSDLNLLYSDLEDFLAGRFIDPDDYLGLLADRLPESLTARGAKVWVDGFSGFTPQEYWVLAALMRTAGRVSVSLCLEADSLDWPLHEFDPFYPVRETYESLCHIAAKEHVRGERPLILDGRPRRFRSAGIAHLEEYFFKRPAKPLDLAEPGVVLAAAANRRSEIEGVARGIVSLSRDRGYRWRDIVVLARDLSLYAELVANVFGDHGIPFFIDQKRPGVRHPLAELVRSALEVAVRDWTFDPVFRYIKTDLASITREEADILENYVLAHGIRGSRWTDGKPWEYRMRRLPLESEDTSGSGQELGRLELSEINLFRERAAEPLSRFCAAARGGKCVRDVITALFNLLSELEAPVQLDCWSVQAEREGRLEEAREHAQVWSGLIELLDQIVESLGDDTVPLEELASIIDEGLSGLRLGLIPPGLDQVVVGSLDRSRSPGARAAFVLGVAEGLLPLRAAEQGVLTDAEREKLASSGIKLAPGARRRAFEEQYLVYIALTRAGESLTLSCPLADGEGGAVAPSPVLERVKELLPGAREEAWPAEPGFAGADDLGFVTGPERALSALVARMREAKAGRPADPLWQDVYSWLVRSGHREECAKALSGLFHKNSGGRLPAHLSRALYGRRLVTGVSGVEKFRACPFAHFLSYGLKLRERSVFKISAPDLGQFFHAALKLFGEEIKEKGLDWGDLGKENCHRLAGCAVDRLAPHFLSEILLSTARQRYLTGKLKRIVQRAALVLSEHASRGGFRPVGLELAFGPGGELPAVTFVLPDGSEMVLVGRIDRVDAATGEYGEVYLRVIDYKSGVPEFRLSDVRHGLKLQLLAYLDVALAQAERLVGKPALPGAVLYFRIDDPLIKTPGGAPAEEELAREIVRSLKMKGLVLADPALVNMMDSDLKGQSDIIPVYLKSDGSFGERSSVASHEQFELLRTFLRGQFLSAGADIAGGVVDISPVRQGKFRYCQHCSYRPVCFFDVLVEGNTYRIVKPEKDAEVLAKLGGGGRAPDNERGDPAGEKELQRGRGKGSV